MPYTGIHIYILQAMSLHSESQWVISSLSDDPGKLRHMRLLTLAYLLSYFDRYLIMHEVVSGGSFHVEGTSVNHTISDSMIILPPLVT